MSKTELQREWQARVAEFQASGLSAAAWAAANDVAVHKLYYWVKRLRATDGQSTTQPQWLPVEFGNSNPSDDCLRVRVGQAIVEVRTGFDPVLLSEVVRSLAKLC